MLYLQAFMTNSTSQYGAVSLAEFLNGRYFNLWQQWLRTDPPSRKRGGDELVGLRGRLPDRKPRLISGGFGVLPGLNRLPRAKPVLFG